MKYCLIITSKDDPHADFIIQKWLSDYKDIKVQPIRLNTEDFLKNIDLTINNFSSDFHISIKDSNKSFSHHDIYSVWFRRPKKINIPKEMESIHDFVLSESQNILDGLYYLLSDKLWLNHPKYLREYSNKILQIKIANHIGFNMLNTIVSNNVKNVVNFFNINQDICIKSLRQPYLDIHEKRYPLLTKIIDKEMFNSLNDDIETMPSQYQHYIKKDYDVRVTVIGDIIFAFAIYSQEHPKSCIDFRGVSSGLVHKKISLDKDLENKIIDFMKIQNLNFSALDFIVSNEKFYFIENNPNGQWLWLELETGVNISDTMIKKLSGINR